MSLRVPRQRACIFAFFACAPFSILRKSGHFTVPTPGCTARCLPPAALSCDSVCGPAASWALTVFGLSKLGSRVPSAAPVGAAPFLGGKLYFVAPCWAAFFLACFERSNCLGPTCALRSSISKAWRPRASSWGTASTASLEVERHCSLVYRAARRPPPLLRGVWFVVRDVCV